MNPDKEHMAIQRLILASKMSESIYKQPLLVTTSGGKDSDVCIALALAAGIRFEVLHNFTSVDAPETIYHVRNTLHRLECRGIPCTVHQPTYHGRPVNMWTLIPQKSMPPTRVVRYCCSILKETGGTGRMITTGVRWEESSRRKKRGIYEHLRSNAKNSVILCNDNDDTRQLFENCRLKSKRICNPIIDWSTADVWDYMLTEHIRTNPLYQCGFSRIGCIGCPLASRKTRQKEFGRYPTYKRAYIRAFDVMLAVRRAHGKMGGSWPIGTTGQDVYHWWMADDVLSGQLHLEDIA